MTIFEIKAANVEYARQLNHRNIFDVSEIFSELKTPINLEIKVAKDVTAIAKTKLVPIFFS